MPLTLITGPANAAKAGAVFERLRAAAPRDPLLVVPTAADAVHYQRELAGSGLVFGVEVQTFARLVGEIAGRAGLSVRPLGPVARERVVRAAVDDVPLRVLAALGGDTGLRRRGGRPLRGAPALPRDPRAVHRGGAAAGVGAPRRRAGAGGRAAYASELAALYAAYRRRLEALGRPDREGHAWAALDALRAAPPSAWGARPVFFYGFDDLTPTQFDAVETLVRHAGADVCVALPYEPGRVAFAVRAATVEELRPLAAEVVHLPEQAEHYAPASRPALHHLERRLFEPGAPRRPPNGAVRLLEAGGERAEAELVGAEVLELMRQGVEAADIAVLLRGDEETAALMAQVLAGYGIPVSHDRRVALERTRLGAGVLAAARAAAADGTAADLLTWLRTPGCLAEPSAADALEARVRRGEVRTAKEARRLWRGEDLEPLPRLDALAEAAATGPEALLDALAAEADALWTAPHHRAGAVLGPEDHADARVAAELRGGGRRAARARGRRSGPAGRPRRHPRRPRRRPGPRAVHGGRHRARGAPPASADRRRAGPPRGSPPPRGAPRRSPAAAAASPGAAPPGVLLADPLAIRARRFRAVFVCGLQEGVFPARPAAEPFLSDEDRRGLAQAAGLRLRCTRTCSTASGRCSTPRSRARRTRSSSPGAPRTRRATRCSRRRSWTTSARSSRTTCGRSAARACSRT